MNQVFFKNITVADPRSKFNGLTTHIRITNGVVTTDAVEEPGETVINCDGLYLSPGWIDCLAVCGEPGEEWKEDLQSLARAAHQGGFTSVAAFCGNHPFPDSSASIHAILSRSVDLPVNILPVGTATRHAEGKEMAELFDIKTAGAVAVCEINAVQNPGLRSRIMEYAANTGIPFLDIPFNRDLAENGMMHDGPVSNMLGIKGIPAIAEINALQTSIEIADWLGLDLRFLGISTEESVARISLAQKSGNNVIAATPVMNLIFTDQALEDFHENFKVLPPLRGEEHRWALINGIKTGVISAVYSNHMPQDQESKCVEFNDAAFGAATIHNTFRMLNTALGDGSSTDLITQLLSYGPSALLNVGVTTIQQGASGDFTVFSMDGHLQNELNIYGGKGVNDPVSGMKLNGLVVGTICKGKWQPTMPMEGRA